MEIIKYTFLIAALFLSGCATTKQVLLHTDDQVGSHYPDIFTNIHYSYITDSNIVICVDALRQQKNIFDDKYHLKDITYEFKISITELEKIKHTTKPLTHVREIYRIPRDNIRECNYETSPPNSKAIKIRGIDINYLRDRDSSGNYRYINLNKIAKYGEHGGMLVTNYRDLLYISEGPNLIKIKTNEPITPGNPALYALVPFTVIYDIVAFPFRALYIIALGAGH